MLDVGCGTGAITQELTQIADSSITGLDINQEFLDIADSENPSANFLLADAHQMPIESSIFDICLCHFLLLWVNTPSTVVSETGHKTRWRNPDIS